jgi:sulfopyruvate decarboxylase TPP-binding subunit
MNVETKAEPEAVRWQDQVYDLLRRHNVTQFAYVPDAGHRLLIDRSLADPHVHSVALTTEEEGVALLAGADLGGARGVLLLQSSGVGNCINMFSLTSGGRFPMLALVSMRGDFAEGNPWRYPMGRATQPVLEAMGVICLRVDDPEEALRSRRRSAWFTRRAMRSPSCSRRSCLAPRNSEADDMATSSSSTAVASAIAPSFVLDRREAVPALIVRHEDFLFVAGLAGTSRDIAALTNDAAHVYSMAGATGGAAMIGLGLALARRDRRVMVLTGDGELLMNLGALATIAVLNPPNLSILLVDNGHYGETGYQRSHTSLGVDLEKIAAGSGIKRTATVEKAADLASGARLLREGNGTAFVLLRVKPTEPPTFKRDLDPARCRVRFKLALPAPA